jgi:hypothetical protein
LTSLVAQATCPSTAQVPACAQPLSLPNSKALVQRTECNPAIALVWSNQIGTCQSGKKASPSLNQSHPAELVLRHWSCSKPPGAVREIYDAIHLLDLGDEKKNRSHGTWEREQMWPRHNDEVVYKGPFQQSLPFLYLFILITNQTLPNTLNNSFPSHTNYQKPHNGFSQARCQLRLRVCQAGYQRSLQGDQQARC